jgi:hypothetical protein
MKYLNFQIFFLILNFIFNLIILKLIFYEFKKYFITKNNNFSLKILGRTNIRRIRLNIGRKLIKFIIIAPISPIKRLIK